MNFICTILLQNSFCYFRFWRSCSLPLKVIIHKGIYWVTSAYTFVTRIITPYVICACRITHICCFIQGSFNWFGSEEGVLCRSVHIVVCRYIFKISRRIKIAVPFLNGKLIFRKISIVCPEALVLCAIRCRTVEARTVLRISCLYLVAENTCYKGRWVSAPWASHNAHFVCVCLWIWRKIIERLYYAYFSVNKVRVLRSAVLFRNIKAVIVISYVLSVRACFLNAIYCDRSHTSCQRRNVYCHCYITLCRKILCAFLKRVGCTAAAMQK